MSFARYHENLRTQTLPTPVLNLTSSSYRSAHLDATRIRTPVPRVDAKQSFELIQFEYDQEVPVLIVLQNNRKFRISFAPGQIQSHLTKSALYGLGFEIAPSSRVLGLKLDLGSITFIDFVKLWNSSQFKVPFLEQFDKGAAHNNSIVIREAFLEEIELVEKDLKSLALSDRQLLLATLWLQCDFIEKRADSLRYCMGNTKTLSSPNQWQNLWLSQTTLTSYNLKNFIYDDELRAAALRLREQDYFEFYRKMAGLDLRGFQALFEQQGVPTKLAELYMAKLRSRLFQLGQVLKIEDSRKTQWDQLSTINDEPYIRNGNFLKNYPHFAVEHSRSNFELILIDLVKKAGSEIESLAKYMLATAPYTGFEMGQLGRVKFAPGFVFRIKRTVIENPSPTGLGDLYFVMDSIEFLVNVGIGVDADFGLTNAFANLGPGYAKNFFFVRSVSSLREAKSTYWSIPKDILWSMNFSKVEPGQLFAVQSGFVGTALAGGGLFTGVPKTKPQAYLLDSVQFLNSFQVVNQGGGKYVIIVSDDRRNVFSAKMFAKLVTKLIRIPFAGYNFILGSGRQEHYEIDLGTESGSKILNTAVVGAALQTGNSRILRENFPKTDMKTAYSWKNWFMHLFSLQKNGYDNTTTLELLDGSSPSKVYQIVGSNRASGAPQSEPRSDDAAHRSCSFTSVQRLKESKPREVIDSGLVFNCDLSRSQIDMEKIRDYWPLVFGLTQAEQHQLQSKIQASGAGGRLTYAGSISGVDLPILQELSSESPDIRTLLRTYNLDLPLTSSLERRNQFILATRMIAIFKPATPTARLKALVKALSESKENDGFRYLILSRARNLSHKIEFSSGISSQLSFRHSREIKSERGSTLDFLIRRQNLIYKNAFDAI
jgi:hypothetical protein